MASQQLDFFIQNMPDASVASYAEAVGRLPAWEKPTLRGAVFTKPEVVDFILDLVGYTEDQPLYKKRLLEPSFGNGDFLLPVIRRLLRSWLVWGKKGISLDFLANSIRAVELHSETFRDTCAQITKLLCQEGLDATTASTLTGHWLIKGDFLLSSLDGHFDFVVGNPPYIRQELLPPVLLASYRSQYHTIYDRADIYIPFIERSLSLLTNGGLLGFICSDRWMKNRYGGPLRDFIARHFHLKIYVDMVNTPAFQREVVAYPAITVISREMSNVTRIARRPVIDRTYLSALSRTLRTPQLFKAGSGVRELSGVVDGSKPWLLEPVDQMALIRRLERSFPALEDSGCRVGIGVATGADNAFIGDYNSMDVEPDRKIPLVMTKDILSGEVLWRGKGVINPFIEGGGLVNLHEYPRLQRYLEDHRDAITRRHCARKNPASWYRTIDRITPSIAFKPKLLIPDIKGNAHIVFEKGILYPHHNLYYVVSDKWDLRALQAVLLSSVTRLFIAAYSTKIRGGFLRFQAQYIRRLRLPDWDSVPTILREELIHAAILRDVHWCDAAVFKLYGFNADERAALGGNGV